VVVVVDNDATDGGASGGDVVWWLLARLVVVNMAMWQPRVVGRQWCLSPAPFVSAPCFAILVRYVEMGTL
jgi:hypothetical protein